MRQQRERRDERAERLGRGRHDPAGQRREPAGGRQHEHVARLTCGFGPGFGDGGTSVQVGSVSATVVDLGGAPIANVEVQACGLNIAYSGATSASGTTTLNVNAMLEQPMFKFGDALTYAKLAAPITMATTTFPSVVTSALPAQGTAFATGDVVNGGVTISIPANDVVTVDMLNYMTADQQKFRAVMIPGSKETALPDVPTLGIEVLYGVAPLETTFCPPVTVTVANTQGWPAGQAVEFYLHGVDVLQEWSPYGGWAKVSDGQVSADGQTVSTTGAGFPALETFGIRKKP
jgi:hypothetical protein